MSGQNDFGISRTNGEVIARVNSPVLNDGNYQVSIWFHDGLAHGEHYFKKENCLLLTISEMDSSHIQKNPNVTGPVVPICKWSFN